MKKSKNFSKRKKHITNKKSDNFYNSMYELKFDW